MLGILEMVNQVGMIGILKSGFREDKVDIIANSGGLLVFFG